MPFGRPDQPPCWQKRHPAGCTSLSSDLCMHHLAYRRPPQYSARPRKGMANAHNVDIGSGDSLAEAVLGRCGASVRAGDKEEVRVANDLLGGPDLQQVRAAAWR